jgi:hypothetical protein
MITSRSRVATPSSSKGLLLAKALGRCGARDLDVDGKTCLPRLSCRKVDLRYSAPPLTACTKAPIRPAARGASKSTGTSQVGIWRTQAGQGAAGGEGADLLGVGQLGGSRLVLYQSSRCMSSPSPAITEHDR